MNYVVIVRVLSWSCLDQDLPVIIDNIPSLSILLDFIAEGYSYNMILPVGLSFRVSFTVVVSYADIWQPVQIHSVAIIFVY